MQKVLKCGVKELLDFVDFTEKSLNDLKNVLTITKKLLWYKFNDAIAETIF